jgi:hypothetical protein
MAKVNIDKDTSGRIVVSFPYDPIIVSRVKAIDGRRWHPAEKHWSFPNKEGFLEKILEVFGRKNVRIDFLRRGLSQIYPCDQRGFDEDRKPFRSDYAEGRRWKPIGRTK